MDRDGGEDHAKGSADGGTAGPPVLVLVFLAEGATRDGYDWLRHPVSDLTALTFRRRRRAPA